MTIAIKFTHRDFQLYHQKVFCSILGLSTILLHTQKFILFMIDDIRWDSQKKILHVSVINGSNTFKGVTKCESESSVGHLRLTLMKNIFSHLIYA